MSRKKFWAFLKNEMGSPIPSASINVYLNGTSTEAQLYSTPVSANGDEINQSTFTTDTSGFFEFYVGDVYESGNKIGYDPDQLFKIEWESTDGIKFGSIDNLQLFYQLFLADPTDSEDTVKNKLVSNDDSFEWSTHVEQTWFHEVHQIEKIDVEDSISSTYNKLVSNALMRDIKTELDIITISGADAITIETSGALGRDFFVPAANWVADSGYYSYTVTHSLNLRYPIVNVWCTIQNCLIQPVEIVDVDENNIKIYTYDKNDKYIMVVGNIG